MSATEPKKWSEMTDVQILLYIIIKCGATIPFNDIATELDTTTAAVRSKIDRLKRKYKNDSGNGNDSDGEGSDKPALSVIPKKRGPYDKPSKGIRKPRSKKVKVAEEAVEEVSAVDFEVKKKIGEDGFVAVTFDSLKEEE